MSQSVITLLIAMISVQGGASAAKILFPVVGAIGATVLRLVLATFMLFLVTGVRESRGSRKLRKVQKDREIKKLGTQDLWVIARYGVALGLMNLCFYLALEKIPLGIAVAVEFTGPLAVALLNSRKASDFLWAVLALVGILLIVPISPVSRDALDVTGVLFALGAAFFWALYITYGRRIDSSIDGMKATSTGMLFAALAVILIGPIGIGLRSSIETLHSITNVITPEAGALALLVAFLSSALPYSLEMIALRKIPAKTFGIFMSLEPVMATLCGIVFLEEHLSFVQWSAMSCIIAASLGSALSARVI